MESAILNFPKFSIIAGFIVIICSVLPVLLGPTVAWKGERRQFLITAEQYAYHPHRIVVNRGDEVHIRLGAKDVVHGFYLEGYDIEAEIYPGRLPFKLRHPSIEQEFKMVDEIVFIAGRNGKFHYRCSTTCGTLHPFMLGEFIVRPNYPYLASTGGAVGIFLAAFVLMFLSSKNNPHPNVPVPKTPCRFDLLQAMPWLKWLVKRRWLQFAVVLPGIAFFILFLMAGFLGSPIGNRNIIITIVWILWWFLLITFLLPFGSRIWCLACPFPFFGEWFQRRRLLGPGPGKPGKGSNRMRGLHKKWPHSLSNIWLQNILFLVMCTFSSILVTRPVTTASALAGIAVAAFVFHLIYRGRTFCLYICPVSGFLGLYAMASTAEVRCKDPHICKKCRTKGCIVGTENGWACPWFRRPNKLKRNNYCGFCMECIKACPNDNMTLRLRGFCADDKMKNHDEVWKAFIMITLALVYAVVLLGPWGMLKGWANISEMGDWQGFMIYVASIWLTSLVLLPAVWFLAAWLGNQMSGSPHTAARIVFVRYAYVLVPLGLIAWITFSFPLIMINGVYVLTTLSDPLGWGWDLFGTAHLHWRPVFPEYLVYIQIPLLLFGLAYALKCGFHISQTLYSNMRQGIRSFFPVGIICMGITLLFLRLFVG